MHTITGHEVETKKAFDWHHQDIINHPPYNHYDMIFMLAQGRFVIEGKQSDIKDAELYADHHNGEPDVFRALHDWDDQTYNDNEIY